jgi:uncharacterized protein with HEPN domain
MRDDRALLIDMLEFARLVQERRANLVRSAFDADPMLQLGIAHALQNIGEAARQVSQNGRELVPDLPWKQIVGMRHRIVHEYFSVDRDRVWDTASLDIPLMVTLLEPVVQPWIDASGQQE